MFRKITLLVLLMAFVSVGMAAAQGGSLQGGVLGESPAAGTMSVEFNVALGVDGLPVMAWSDGSVYKVAQWDGSAWQDRSAGLEEAELYDTRLVANAAGDMLLLSVGATESGGGALTAYFYDGTSWAALGERVTQFDSGAYNFDQTAMLTAQGPVVAWHEAATADFSAPNGLYVAQWDGSAWQLLGEQPLSEITDYEDEALALAELPEGQLLLAADEGAETVIRQWDGSTWTTLPGVANPEGIVIEMLDLAVAPDGRVALFRQYYDNTHDVSLWQDGAWTLLAGLENDPAMANTSYVTNADISFTESGSIALTWGNGSDGVASYLLWTGDMWQAYNVPLPEDMVSFTSAALPLAIAPDGTLYAAYTDSAFTVQTATYSVQ